MSGRSICLLSCSRRASVPSGIRETPREASYNGPLEGSCIPVNVPLSHLSCILSLVVYFVLYLPAKGDGAVAGERDICLFDGHFDTFGIGVTLVWGYIGNKGL